MGNEVKDEITINGERYIRGCLEPAVCIDGMEYKIIRCASAGVFAGYISIRDGREVVIINARRLWYWDGAASLSQLAMEGVKRPENCKFAMEVDEVLVLDAIEILSCTKKSQESIKGVSIWKE